METLPQEIADKIFNDIFQENPQDVYRLRLVSKTWESIIDGYTARLFQIWCKKCSDEIPQSYLDDFMKMRYPQFLSWQKYCSSELASVSAHIAQDIYVSWNTFPNLGGHPHYTEILPSPEITDLFTANYAVHDKYFAVSFEMPMPMEQIRNVTRIYPINDLTHHMREYPMLSRKMDFYTTDNQVFIVLLKSDFDDSHYMDSTRISLGKFLEDDCLVSANLPILNNLRVSDFYMDYAITKNQCFTFENEVCANYFQHHRLTSNGFEMSTMVQLPPLSDRLSRRIGKTEIFNSKLIMFAYVRNKFSRVTTEVIYAYEFTRQLDDKLIFSDAEIYENQSAISKNFVTEDISLQDIIFDHCPHSALKHWLEHFYKQHTLLSFTIYAYHVLIQCKGKFIVFQGNLRQLMNYAVTDTDPGSRCTAFDVKSKSPEHRLNSAQFVHVIHNDSKLKFLVVTKKRVFTIDFIL